MSPSTAETVLTMQDFRSVQEIIYRHCGIRLPDTKLEMVQGRLRRRLQACQMTSYKVYLDSQPSHSFDDLTAKALG